MYILTRVRQQVVIKASFILEDGTQFILFNCNLPSLLEIQVVKKLSLIFCQSAFDHTFGLHQRLCSLNWQLSLSFIVLIICNVFILKWSVGTFSTFCFKAFNWKGFDKYMFCWMSYLIRLVISVIKNVQYIITCVKYYFINVWVFIFFMHIVSRICNRFLLLFLYIIIVLSVRCKSPFSGGRHRLLRHSSRGTTRRHTSPIPIYHQSRLRT